MTISPIIAILIHKALLILLSLILFWWANQSFKKSNPNKTGIIDAKWGDIALTLKNSPPGTIMLIVGLAITLVTVFSKSSFEEKKKTNSEKSERLTDSSKFTIPETPAITRLNIDSIILLAEESQLQDKHLEALKYLYIIKGYCLANKCDSLQNRILDYRIKKSEKLISMQLNKNVIEKSSTEETRSTKIKDTSDAEIR